MSWLATDRPPGELSSSNMSGAWTATCTLRSSSPQVAPRREPWLRRKPTSWPWRRRRDSPSRMRPAGLAPRRRRRPLRWPAPRPPRKWPKAVRARILPSGCRAAPLTSLGRYRERPRERCCPDTDRRGKYGDVPCGKVTQRDEAALTPSGSSSLVNELASAACEPGGLRPYFDRLRTFLSGQATGVRRSGCTRMNSPR